MSVCFALTCGYKDKTVWVPKLPHKEAQVANGARAGRRGLISSLNLHTHISTQTGVNHTHVHVCIQTEGEKEGKRKKKTRKEEKVDKSQNFFSLVPVRFSFKGCRRWHWVDFLGKYHIRSYTPVVLFLTGDCGAVTFSITQQYVLTSFNSYLQSPSFPSLSVHFPLFCITFCISN